MINQMAIINMILKKYPNFSGYWETAQKMAKDKTPEELATITRNVAKQGGVNIDEVEKKFNDLINGKIKL